MVFGMGKLVVTITVLLNIGIIGPLDDDDSHSQFQIRRIPNPFIELGQNLFVTYLTDCWQIGRTEQQIDDDDDIQMARNAST